MSCTETPAVNMNPWNPRLAETTAKLLKDTASVAEERKSELNALAQWTAETLNERGQADLIFICTHNSRRSHLSQVWAQVGAEMAGLKGVRTFSGGTEATACNPRTVAAMERAGFDVLPVDTLHGASNPTYAVSAMPSAQPMPCFSKTYGDDANPQEGFAAVMTCSSADRGCPVVYGAAGRFAIPYIDPKVSDGTPQEAATYDARLRQIGTEMLYMMGQVAERVKR